jgi:hypothetical protein
MTVAVVVVVVIVAAMADPHDDLSVCVLRGHCAQHEGRKCKNYDSRYA